MESTTGATRHQDQSNRTVRWRESTLVPVSDLQRWNLSRSPYRESCWNRWHTRQSELSLLPANNRGSWISHCTFLRKFTNHCDWNGYKRIKHVDLWGSVWRNPKGWRTCYGRWRSNCPSCATIGEKAARGVMITASHNPYHDNGIKIFSESGRKLTDVQQNYCMLFWSFHQKTEERE